MSVIFKGCIPHAITPAPGTLLTLAFYKGAI